MVSEVRTSGFGYESAVFQARRTDSASRQEDKSARLGDKFQSEDKSRFAVQTRERDVVGRKSQPTADAQTQSTAFLRKALSTPYSRGADLYGVEAAGRNLQGANYAKADLRTGDLVGANLAGADLRGADLSNADLAGADLTGANLTGANFTGANIAGAKLSGAIGTKYDASGRLTVDRAISLPRIDILA
ncbi:hypothetical protein MTBLM1_10308 [Rhodospirillaceae bacterium LM-1]|nr:hypothetical protein MTBLM1_10308 [Rhodospirillaceae bacterium LM-1]